MRAIKSIKYNLLMNSILSMSSLLFPLLIYPYVSRVLQVEGIGKVTLATTFVSYFTMFCMLGIPTYGIRTVAKFRDNKEELSRNVQEILILNGIATTIVACLFVTVVLNTDELLKNKTLYLICGLNLILTPLGVEWLYSGIEQYEYITKRSILFKTISMILTFILVKSKNDYIYYALTLVIANGGSYLLNLVNLRKYINLKPAKNIQLRRHIQPILTFFSMTIAISIYSNLDILMLGFMKNDFEVGNYTTAVKVENILLLVVNALGTVLLPRMSYFIANGMEEQFIRTEKKALNFIFVIAVPLVIYFMVFAKETIFLLSGKGYYGAILPMIIIMPVVLITGITNNLGNQVLIPHKLEKTVLRSVMLGAAVDFVLNLVLINKYGASGAAFSTVFAVFMVMLYELNQIKSQFQNKYIEILRSIKLKQVTIATLVGIVPSFAIKYVILDSNIGKLFVSFLLFFLSYIFVLYVQKNPLVEEFLDIIIKRK